MMATRECQLSRLKSCLETTQHNFGVLGYVLCLCSYFVSKILVSNDTPSDT
jgi:hypothetical protein